MKIFEPGAQYTFLAGAGISMDAPSNLPSAIAFVKKILEMCTLASESTFFAKESHKLRYELIVEYCHELFDADLVFLDYLELVNRPNPIHFFLASMLLNKQFVITTNFDYSHPPNMLTISLNMGVNFRDGLQDVQNAILCLKKARDAATHLKNKQVTSNIDALIKSLK